MAVVEVVRGESSTVKSAERALAVLRFLGTRARPVSAMVIARECSLPRSSAYHLLNVLLRERFVAYYPDDRVWGLGDATRDLSSSYLRSDSISRFARPLIQQLSSETGVESSLALMRGADVHYPLHSCGRQSGGVGLPAHLTAGGQAMLMRLSPSEFDAFYPREQPLLRPPTDSAKLVSELRRDLVIAREHGVAVVSRDGNRAVAAPVFSRESWVVAAIEATPHASEVASVSHAVIETATMLSRRLGAAWLPEDEGPGSDATERRAMNYALEAVQPAV